MPLWLELLINCIGYAGFIAIAMFNKSSDEKHSSPGSLRARPKSSAGHCHTTDNAVLEPLCYHCAGIAVSSFECW
jgi:hypothetical protein